jgi:hypothetical protein
MKFVSNLDLNSRFKDIGLYFVQWNQKILLHVEEIYEDNPTKSVIYKKPKKQMKFVSNLDLRSNIPCIWFNFFFQSNSN